MWHSFASARGRIGGKMFGGNPILLLTTVGNKSGKKRTVPVMAFEDNGVPFVIASMGGRPKNPAWFNNLSKTPEVTVELPGRRFRARAEQVMGEERDRLFEKAAAQMPQFAGYEKRAQGHRVIPVVRLVS
jgi:deazaflavin-dependent oxidoreductase (nitroreductase family)